MNSFIETLNQRGEIFLSFAWPVFWQSSLLIGVLLALDFLLRRKLRASIRYALWLIVLAKLILPPTLALPTSPVWWLHQPPPVIAKTPKPNYTVTYDQKFSAEIPEQTLPTVVPPKPKLTVSAWLLAISISMSAFLLCWLLVRWWQITRQVRHAKTSERLNGIADAAQTFLGLKMNVAVKLTTNSMSPAVCGLFRPTILIPQSLAENFSDEQLRAVLLHELIHLRRRDVWVNFLQALLQIFYWWHPLVWLANACIRQVREEAVDDAVMLALRDEAESYAPTLLEVAKLALNRPLVSLGLVGIMESRNALRQRIERLLNFRAPKKAGLTILSCCGIGIFSAIALPMGEKPNDAAENNFAVTTNEIAKAATNVKTNVPEILITGHFYRGSATEVEKILSQQKPAVRSVDENSWVISAKGFRPIHDELNAGAFRQISRPRVLTSSGKPAEFYMGNQTNSISFSCSPVVIGESIHLGLDSKITDALAGTTNHFQINLTAENKGGFLIHAKNAEASTASLFVFVGVEIITNSAAWERQQRSKSIAASQTVENPTNFYTRTFKVDSKILISNLQHVGMTVDEKTNSAAISKSLRKFFATLGVDMETPAGKTVFYNDRNDLMLVRATGADLDVIERAFVILNQVAPQIHIKARFYQITRLKSASVNSNDWYLSNLNLSGTNPVTGASVTGILNRENFRIALRALQSRKDVEILAEPEVTTTGGRQLQMRATQIVTVITNVVYQTSLTNANAVVFNTGVVETGPILDVVPRVLADGYTLNLTMIPSLTDFLGYDSPPYVPNLTGTNHLVQLPVILPRFSTRQVVVNLNLFDGQTAVIGGLIETHSINVKDKTPVLGNVPLMGHLFRSSRQHEEESNLFVFITAEIVDPAGNRVHKDDEIPFTPNGIPPQPAK